MEHHAFVVYADSIADAHIDEKLKHESLDVQHIRTDAFSIDAARNLTVAAQSKPLENSLRTFVIETRSMALDAQNALLKLFEEPPAHVQFFLVVPKSFSCIPTLMSRVHVGTQNVIHNEVPEAFLEFKRASFAKRLTLIAEKTKEKDRLWQEAIIFGCEQEAHGNQALLTSVVFARTYMPYKGSSMKMLLEELALSLPS